MSDVIIKFIGESEGLKPVEDSLKKINNLTEKEEAVLNDVNNAAKNLGQTTAKNNEQVKKTTDQFSKLKKEITEGAKVMSNGAAVKLTNQLKETAQKADVLTKSFKTSKQELRALTNAINSGQLNGDELKQATIRAAELTDEIGDVSNAIRMLASDTRSIDLVVEGAKTMAAGFAIAEGASALLGGQNEELQKSILRVQAAMSVLNGVQEVANTLTTKGGIATVAYGYAIKAVEVIQKAFAVSSAAAWAIATGGVTLLIAGLTAIYYNFEKIKEALGFATIDMEAFNKQNEKANEIAKENNKLIETKTRALKANGATQREILQAEIAILKTTFESYRILNAKNEEQKAKAGKLLQDNVKNSAENIATYGVVVGTIINKLSGLSSSAESFGEISKKSKEGAEEITNIAIRIRELQNEIKNLDSEAIREAAEKRAKAEEDRVKNVKEFSEKVDKYIIDSINNEIASIEKRKLFAEQTSLEMLELIASEVNARKNLLKLNGDLSKEQYNLELAKLDRFLDEATARYLIAVKDRQAKVLAEINNNRTLQENLQRDFNLSQEEIDKEYFDSSFQTFTDYEKWKRDEMNRTFDEKKRLLEEEKQLQLEVTQFAMESAKEIFNTLFTIDAQLRNERFNAQQKQINDLKEKEINAVKEQLEQGIITKEKSEKKIEDINEKYRKQEAAAKKRAYIADRQAKIAQAAMNGALAVTAILATYNPSDPFGIQKALQIAAATITTAAQIAVISSTPIPAFAKGTKGSKQTPAGFKLVGEHGPEIIYTPGKEKIITATDTAKILANYNIQTTKEVFKPESISSTSTIDYDRLSKSIGEEIKKHPRLNVNIDEKGLFTSINSANERRNFLNKKIKFGNV